MTSPVEVGRYQLYDAIAAGGMATVHAGRILGAAGFSRLVAIKRLHPHLARDTTFAAMFLDEARLASRIQHPNVIGTLDVVAQDGELFLVMDYVRGSSLSELLHRAAAGSAPAPSVAVIVAIVVGTLYGLHAAHEARDTSGQPLDIVHRDVSPQNVLVGTDGVARVVDFGIAKAVSRLHSTRDGELKGKLAYMAPEQLGREGVDRRTDVYGAAVVLWEALAGRRLFTADDTAGLVGAVLTGEIAAPSKFRHEIPPSLDEVVLRGLARSPRERFPTALAMAEALVAAVSPAAPRDVGEWVREAGGEALRAREERIAELERGDPPRTTGATGIEGMVLTGTARRELVDSATKPIDASVVETPPPDRSASRRIFVVTALIVAVSAVAFAATLSSLRKETAPSPSTTTAEPSIGVPAPTSSTPPPSTSATLSSSPSAPPSAPSEAPSSTAVKAAPHRPAVRRVAPAPSAPKTPSCDPPYTIDESGIKRFKRWCSETP